MTPGWNDLARAFGRIGLLSFGGPAAQIALMHKVLVEERKWLSEQEYLNALSFCMLLPGPEAMQLATYSGWKLRGTPGGLLAGLFFVLPGAAVIAVLATIYALYGNLPLVATLFVGVKAVIVVIVIEALLKVSKRALKGRAGWAIAGSSAAGMGSERCGSLMASPPCSTRRLRAARRHCSPGPRACRHGSRSRALRPGAPWRHRGACR